MISIQHMLEKFKIHNPPRGIILTQTTILKHTFQFGLAKDCFQNFTLVCKSWNLAVETTKFKNQSPPYQVCKLCSPPSLTRLSKVLSSFDTLYMNFNSPPFLSDRQFARSRSVVPINENLLDQILCKMKFLKKIQFVCSSVRFGFDAIKNPNYEFYVLKPFFLKLVSKHQDTLKFLSIPHFFSLPTENQSDYTNLKIYSSRFNNGKSFKNCLKVFEKFGFPKLIHLHSFSQDCISQYIDEHYKKNSILGTFNPRSVSRYSPPIPNYLSVKFLQLQGCNIFITKDWLELPWTYGLDVLYLNIKTSILKNGNKPVQYPKWENFKLLLQHLPNLKGICFNFSTVHNVQNIFPLYEIYLQNREIKNLSIFQFEKKIEETSKNLPFIFHLDSKEYSID